MSAYLSAMVLLAEESKNPSVCSAATVDVQVLTVEIRLSNSYPGPNPATSISTK